MASLKEETFLEEEISLQSIQERNSEIDMWCGVPCRGVNRTNQSFFENSLIFLSLT
jgi:hypothetical protein